MSQVTPTLKRQAAVHCWFPAPSCTALTYREQEGVHSDLLALWNLPDQPVHNAADIG